MAQGKSDWEIAHIPGEVNGSCSFAMGSVDVLDQRQLPLVQLIGSFAFEAARRLSRQGASPGVIPEPLRKRYFSATNKWSGEPAYFTTAQAKEPAFRDQGRRLIISSESAEAARRSEEPRGSNPIAIDASQGRVRGKHRPSKAGRGMRGRPRASCV